MLKSAVCTHIQHTELNVQLNVQLGIVLHICNATAQEAEALVGYGREVGFKSLAYTVRFGLQKKMLTNLLYMQIDLRPRPRFVSLGKGSLTSDFHIGIWPISALFPEAKGPR